MSIITLCLNPALDKSTSLERLVSGDKLSCDEPRYEAGGGGINVSRVLLRLGVKSKAIMQSSGPSGEHIQLLLSEEGVDFMVVESKAWTRENFIVFEKSSHLQYRFGMPGPSLTTKELKNCESIIKAECQHGDILVVSGSLPEGVSETYYASLCSWANEMGIRVILDTKGAALKKALLAGVYLVKPNLKELADLVGENDISAERAEEIATHIVKDNLANKVVVSLGANGAMMVSDKGTLHLASPKVEVKSAVGAGDSMVAGMVWAIQNGLSDEEVLKYGVACGTAAALTPGTELCNYDQLLDVLKLIDG